MALAAGALIDVSAGSASTEKPSRPSPPPSGPEPSPETSPILPFPLPPSPSAASSEPSDDSLPDEPVLQFAFAGDIHFEGAYTDLPSDPEATLGAMSDILREADLAMVNLESAVAVGGDPASKELEDPAYRYWFRTEPAALDLLERSGVDVVSVANNHGADFGLTGVRETIAAAEASNVAVVGIGRNERQAYAPHRVRIQATDIAIHAADASPLESADPIWAAAPGTGPGIAAGRGAGAEMLATAVRESAATDDIVIVYLHWGEEGNFCPTPAQENLAEMLSEAGADIIVGTHAHLLLGAGMRGPTYVSYGLGNFYWYHGRESETGVLRVSVRGGEVIGDEWLPAEIPPEGGAPVPLAEGARSSAVQRWQELRGCTDLEPGPGPIAEPEEAGGPRDPEPTLDELPSFISSVNEIGLSVQSGMHSHDPATCPVPLTDLRHLVVTYVGFDGRAHLGELVVHRELADDVVDVFAALYAERFPIERMQLIDEYGGDDNLSMAANNTSAYNCRLVAGQSHWSDHAYGRAIDINPVQNPYVVGGDVRPPAAAPFVDVDRSEGSQAVPGVIREGDVVRREFDRLGWRWGGFYSEPDFQHFSAPG